MTLSYANGPSTQPLLGETIGENLERTAGRVARQPPWVKVREGATLTEDALKEFCKGRIAHYKVPRYIKFTDEFPMTVTGKIQKFKMREQAVEELGLQSAAGVQTA